MTTATDVQTTDVSAIQAKTQLALVHSEELNAALADEREQRIALMAMILQTIRPALPALVGAIRTARLYDNNGRGRDRSGYHTQKGLRLDGCGTRPGPVCDDGDRGGAFTGWDTFLLTDGSLLELHYKGVWSVYDQDTDAWEVEAEIRTDFASAAEHLVSENSDKAAIQSIGAALDQQLQPSAKSLVQGARDRAKKLRAVLALASNEGGVVSTASSIG